ncbi:MAG: DUF4065 domain-containing protein [Bacillota bacterium]
MNNKLHAILEYLVTKLEGNITRTQLVKYVYLYDLIAKPKGIATGVTWRNYYYGPYSEEVIDVLRNMNGYEIIEEQRYNSYLEKFYYLYKKGPVDLEYALGEEEREILDKLIEEYKSSSLEELLIKVYKTDQYQKSDFGEVIPI